MPAGGHARHLTEHSLRGQRCKRQSARGIGQKLLQRLAQRIARRAQKQRSRRGVEDGDALAAVQADDGVQRRVDDRLQPAFTGVELLIALLQRLALGQQRALIDHGAQILQRGRAALLRYGDSGHMQVAAKLLALGNLKDDFMHLGAASAARLLESQFHPLRIAGMDKRLEVDQQAVFFRRLKSPVRHGIGLHHEIVLIDHQQRQRNAGKQRLKPLGRALGHCLAVVENLVLQLQLMLVIAQLGHQRVQRIIVFGNDGLNIGRHGRRHAHGREQDM